MLITTIKPPNNLCIYSQETIDKSLKFIAQIGEYALSKEHFVKLDLSDLNYVTAAASVLLFSEITKVRAQSPHGFNSVKIVPPRNNETRKQLNRSGFLRAINLDVVKYPDNIWNLKTNYLTGNDPQSDLKRFSKLMTKMYDIKKLPYKLSAAISETLLNIQHHAYIPTSVGGTLYHPPIFIRNRWWACFEIYKNGTTNVLKCVILDRGHGIVNTINSSRPFFIRTQEETFKHAMLTGVTRTRNPERGKGSEDIRMPIDITKNERDFLSIMSHTITYTVLGDSDPSCETCTSIIPGTIVEWQLEFYD